MGKGPVAEGANRRLLTHKENAVKMVKSIIKEKDLDPCAEQTTKDLGVSGLFDLSRICFFPQTSSHFLFTLSLAICFDLRR